MVLQVLMVLASLMFGIILGLLMQRRPGADAGHLYGFISRVVCRGVTLEGVIDKMNLRDDQQVKATVKFKDSKGADADIQEGSVQWASSNTAVATVTPDANDPLSAIVAAQLPPPRNPDGTPGPAVVIEVTAKDAATGDPVTAQGSINVVAGDAKIADLEFADPTPEPAAAPAEPPAPAGGTTGTTENPPA